MGIRLFSDCRPLHEHGFVGFKTMCAYGMPPAGILLIEKYGVSYKMHKNAGYVRNV